MLTVDIISLNSWRLRSFYFVQIQGYTGRSEPPSYIKYPIIPQAFLMAFEWKPGIIPSDYKTKQLI